MEFRIAACVYRWMTVSGLLWGLVACGGGGGSDAIPAVPAPPPPPLRDSPLVLNSANAATAATLAMGYGSVALGLAQLSLDLSSEIDAAGSLTRNSSCPSGGSRGLVLQDKDGNGRVSAGDQLTATLNACYVPALEDKFSGTLILDFSAPPAGTLQAGTLTMGPDFGTSDDAGATILVQGSLRFESRGDRLARTVRVQSATTAFSVQGRVGGKTTLDQVSSLDASREVRRDTARVELAMRYQVASDLLGGSLDISTGTPWRAWFDAYPDAGELSIRGAAAGGTLAMRADGTGSAAFSLSLGTVQVGVVACEDVSLNVLWTGSGLLPQDGNATIPKPLSRSAIQRFALISSPAATLQRPKTDEWTWQFSRPVIADPLPRAVLRKTMGTGAGYGGMDVVPVIVRVEGSLLSIKPEAQLVPGARYELTVNDRSIYVATGPTASVTVPLYSFEVERTVTASARLDSPGLLLGSASILALDASSSSTSSGSMPTVQWRQVSGPALVLQGANSMRPTVSPAVAANGLAVLELQARNSEGELDLAQVSVPVLADMTDRVLAFSVREGNKPAEVHTSVAAGAPTFLSRYLPALSALNTYLQLPGVSGNYAFTAGFLSPRQWQTGVDERFGIGGSADVYVRWFPASGQECITELKSGRFQVLDVEIDTAGTLLRLALDFEQTCGDAANITRGSIRYNSAIPLRP